jgi:hypothetical protein
MAAPVQAVLFVDDKTVSKGMVKYASAIPRESIIDISGEVDVPKEPIAACSCSQVAPSLPAAGPRLGASTPLPLTLQNIFKAFLTPVAEFS